MFACLIIRTLQLIFFSRNIIFLSPQISRNSVPAGFSDQPNTAKDERDNEGFKLKPKT
jgi:hypothetical protein